MDYNERNLKYKSLYTIICVIDLKSIYFFGKNEAERSPIKQNT